MTEFTQPYPTRTATELLPKIPGYLGEAREDHLLQLFQQGQYPGWLRQWHEVRVMHELDSGIILRGAFYVMPDFLCVGSDEDYLYTPMGAPNAERVLSLFNAVLPTPKMVQDTYNTCVFTQVAQPWGPPYDSAMTRTSRWPVQTKKIRKAMKLKGYIKGELVEGHLKNVTVSEKMVKKKGRMLSFFGWYDARGRHIQGDSMAHVAEYCDYAHGVRGVLNEVEVEGKMMSLEQVLSHPEYHVLFTSKGPFSPASYRACRA